MWRRIASVLVYPATTGGAVWFCAFGLAHGWPVWAIGVCVIGACSVLVASLERALPYSAVWARPHGDQRTDIWHFVISNRGFELGTFFAIFALAPLGARLAGRIGMQLWPHAAPVALQAILALIIVEFSLYWIHRLEHTSPLLFRLHSVHHSAPRMHWWNLARNHPLDNFASAALSIGPLVLLGVDEAPLAYVAAFSGAHAMLQHSNVDQRTGVLDWLFTTARVHRFHHSRSAEESLANYSPTLTFWDFVFRTRRFSADAIPPEDVGLDATLSAFPMDFVGQLRAPFDTKLFRSRRPA